MTKNHSAVRGALGVGVLFASNGAVFAALLPWYPLLSERLDLNPVEFGFIVAAFAVGGIVSSAAPAPLIARFGPVRVAFWTTVLLAAAVASAPWGGAGWLLALSLFSVGLFDAVVDVAQNVAGIRMEDSSGRTILSSMHALWSLGGVASGIASTAAAAAGVDVRAYLAGAAAVAIVLVGAGALLLRDLPEPSARVAGGTAHQTGIRWKPVAVAALPLVVIAVSGTMVEDVANNWAAMSAVQLGGMAPSVAGIAFTVVIGSQCLGRFTGDLLIARFGRAAIARTGGALIALGGVLVVTTDDAVWQLLLGLALAGYGSATIVPSALAAAGKLPGVSEGAGVTIVSWLMRTGFLVTSPLIGSVAAVTELRVALGILIAIGTAALVLAGALAPRMSRYPRSSA
jgi:MFS family permease